MAIGLSDYTFRLNDTGVTLNADSVLPYVDIEKVSGLDNAQYRETIRDHEGTDGGFIDAEFEKGRDIILDGTIYTVVGSEEIYLDSLKANYAPVQSPIPLYIKAPGAVERLIYVKPRGVRYDWEAIRRVGITSAQFLMFAEDPRIYDATQSSLVINYGGDVVNGFSFATYRDDFQRSVTDSLGTSDTGHTYTLTGTAADFDVDGSTATITLTAATGTVYFASVNSVSAVNHWFRGRAVRLSATPTGGTISTYYDVRVVDANNFYRAEVIYTTSNTVQVALIKVVGGTPTTLVSATTISSITSSTLASIRVEITQGQSAATGSLFRVKMWDGSSPEPSTFQVESAIDSSVTATGGVRIGAVRNAGNTNTNPQALFGYLEWDQGIGFNLDFGGGATPGGGSLTNIGNRSTPATFVITGPIINPVITNATSSHTMTFNITLGALDTLTINTRDRTVYLNDNANRRNVMTSPDWFFLDPGVTFIAFGGTTGTGSTLQVLYRSAWR